MIIKAKMRSCSQWIEYNVKNKAKIKEIFSEILHSSQNYPQQIIDITVNNVIFAYTKKGVIHYV